MTTEAPTAEEATEAPAIPPLAPLYGPPKPTLAQRVDVRMPATSDEAAAMVDRLAKIRAGQRHQPSRFACPACEDTGFVFDIEARVSRPCSCDRAPAVADYGGPVDFGPGLPMRRDLDG